MRGDGWVYERVYKSKTGAPNTSRWWIAYFKDGEEFREPGGKTEEEAEKKLAKIRRTLHSDDFITPAQRNVRVDELLDDLIKHLETKGAKSVPSFKSYLKPVREFFGSKRAVAVTTAHVREFIEQELEAEKARATINRSTGALRQALRLALKEERLTRVPYIPMLTEDNARQGFVEPAAFEAVVAHLPTPVDDIARFAYGSGWRKGEILPLRWDAVDRRAKEVRLYTSKNGRPRTLPLAEDLWAVIERRWKAREFTNAKGLTEISEYVFHSGDGHPVVDFRKSWQTACLKAGTPLLFHDLRRSAVRNLIRAGVSQPVAMSISGHRTVSMFLRYDITSEEDKREALRKTQAHVNALAALPTTVAAGDFGGGGKGSE